MVRNFTVDKDGIYRSGDLVMVPGGVERILVHLFYAFEEQRLLEILFHEGAKPTLRWFLSEYMKPERSTLTCYRQSPDGPYNGLSPLGITWINKTWSIGEKFKKAEVGMGFVRHIPVDDTVTLGEMTIHWAFSNLNLDTLVGTTPYPNKAARLFGLRLGFQQTTELEGYSCWQGKLCSVVLQSLTRTRWREMNRAREAA